MANLQNANLEGADLRCANLKDANLEGANLKNANLEDANLKGAYFAGANFQGSSLSDGDHSRTSIGVSAQQHQTVGGWLLLLCVLLTVITPIRTSYNLIIGYHAVAQYFELVTTIETLFYIDAFLSSIIIVLSIRAGWALWSIKPGAVKIAKNYLLIYLGYVFIISLLPFTAGLSPEINRAMIPGIVEAAVYKLVFFGVWYSYLSVSKRVKATYVVKDVAPGESIDSESDR